MSGHFHRWEVVPGTGTEMNFPNIQNDLTYRTHGNPHTKIPTSCLWMPCRPGQETFGHSEFLLAALLMVVAVVAVVADSVGWLVGMWPHDTGWLVCGWVRWLYGWLVGWLAGRPYWLWLNLYWWLSWLWWWCQIVLVGWMTFGHAHWLVSQQGD